MVDARKYFGVIFVTLKEVADGPLRGTAGSVAEGQFGKLNVNFEEGFALSLNATNARELAKAYGANTDGWLGHVIELYAGEIEYQGKLQPAVRVKPISKASPAATKKSSSDTNDEIPF